MRYPPSRDLRRFSLGPWGVTADECVTEIHDADYKVIAEIGLNTDSTELESHANSALMAAAPNMLQLLARVYNSLLQNESVDSDTEEAVRVMISNLDPGLPDEIQRQGARKLIEHGEG